MRERVFRTIVWILIGIASFFMGYYNQEIQTFFFNKNALIGALSASLMFYILYAQYLDRKILKQKLYHESAREELQNLREGKYRRKNLTDKMDEVKKGMLGALKSRADELYKSMSLRDDMFKKQIDEIRNEISNLRKDA